MRIISARFYEKLNKISIFNVLKGSIFEKISKDVFAGFLIFLTAYNLFIYRINEVRFMYGDEPLYLSAARQILAQGNNENWSHPPLGKALIALGLYFFGDNTVGWRIASVLSGSLILVVMYFLGLILFQNRRAAVLVTFLSAFNQILFVESRVACLDIHMFAAISLGLLFFLRYWLQNKSQKNLMIACLFFGIGIAIKWFAVVPLALCALLILIKTFGKLDGSVAKIDKANRPTMTSIILPFISVIAVYFVFSFINVNLKHPTYAPQLHNQSPEYGILDLILVQLKMLKAQWSFHYETLMHQSRWYSWPFIREFTWYHLPYVHSDGTMIKRGLGLIGNPVVMWTGVPMIVLCLFKLISKRSFEALFIVTFYFGMFLFWAIVPRTVTFYYYYFPSAMILSLAIAYVFKEYDVHPKLQLLFCITVLYGFIYSYPLISNQFLPEDEFNKRHYVLTLGNEGIKEQSLDFEQ